MAEARLRAIAGHLLDARRASVGAGDMPSSHVVSLHTEDVCGIVGYVASPEVEGNAVDILFEGLRILENRGYDSAGITTIDAAKSFVTTKCASSEEGADAIQRLAQTLGSHAHNKIGIAHTRWATHGGKTDINAHPHLDQQQRIAVVHNGVIENSFALKKELQQEGVRFVSETDTEVIAQLIGKYVQTGISTLQAVNSALARLQGTWGLAIVDRENPDHVIVAKNGSPILIGIGQGRMFIASEPTAFARYTKDFIALQDGEVAVVHPNSQSLDVSRIEQVAAETIETSPAPYPHWTIKEIMEQPQALSSALNYGGRLKSESSVKLGGLDQNKDKLMRIQHLVIAACGSSLHAAIYVDAAEMTRDLFPRRNGGLLVISQSGETKDVHRVLVMADDLGIPTFSVVNIVRSLIARSTSCGVYLNAGREIAVASTKAFTNQVAVLSLVAIWFSQERAAEEYKTGARDLSGPSAREDRRRVLVEALHRLPMNSGMILGRLRSRCQEIALKLEKSTNMFVLGKGPAYPVALEGALKIKEITYMHAEGYSGGALKHGPFALIDDSVPIILIILQDEHEHLMKTALQEVKTRNAYTIVITDTNEELGHETLHIPKNGPLTALLAVLPLQLIAYEVTVLRGRNPDKPRNLAKTITVD